MPLRRHHLPFYPMLLTSSIVDEFQPPKGAARRTHDGRLETAPRFAYNAAMFPLPRPCLIGMIHLPALPGSPNHRLSMEEIVAQAVGDGRTLKGAGFDALMIENFGDVPLPAGRLEPATVAAMAVAAAAVRAAVSLPLGINALRNDAVSALGIAAAVGASFIRVNVHTGVAATDQGMLTGSADETLRYRQRLNLPIAILADVHVKHSQPVSQPDIALAAEETAYRGLADGLIVSGATTGRSPDVERLRRVKRAVPDRPLLVGSGADASNIGELLALADGVIVGTSLKVDRRIENPIDAQLAEALVRAARGS